MNTNRNRRAFAASTAALRAAGADVFLSEAATLYTVLLIPTAVLVQCPPTPAHAHDIVK